MSKKRYGFCRIFVADTDTATVMALLGELLGSQGQRRSLVLPGLIFDVRPNPDAVASPVRAEDFRRVAGAD